MTSEHQKPIAIIQARMNSKRFPGKVLCEINGKPLLAYLIETVKQCRSLGAIFVATSAERSDDAVQDFCSRSNVPCFRGGQNNVAGRFKDILEIRRTSFFVRLCGDSPLLDFRLIDDAVRLYESGHYDVVTNLFPRSFPKGQSVEVLNTDTYLSAYEQFDREEDFEHVTKFFYRNAEGLRIRNVALKENLSEVNLSVNTSDDLEIFERIISHMHRAHWTYELKEIVELYNQVSAKNTC